MNEIHPEEIGFDFDGVIADTARSFINIAQQKYNFSCTVEDIVNFDIETCIGMPIENVNAIFMAIMKDSIATDVQPMQGAMETLGLMAASHKVTIITARPGTTPVESWLSHHLSADLLPNISLTAMGDHDDKIRYAKEKKLKYFIDDRAATCLQFADAGLQPFVFEQPWNRGRHSLPTVTNWQDIRNLLTLS